MKNQKGIRLNTKLKNLGLLLLFLTALGTSDANAISESEIKIPSIEFSKDTCALCRMVIREKKFSASLVSEKNSLAFDDIGDLLIYLKKNKEESYIPWVYDYNSEKLLKANSAFFVITKSVQTPMRHGIIAFEKETDALTLKEKNGGDFFNGFSDLYKYFLNNSDKFSFSEKNNQMDMNGSSHSHHLGFRGQPIGIMGAHTHNKNSLMISYRFMYMNMGNILSGTQIVSKEEILKNFSVVPGDMNMFMHMAGVMYSLTDDLTIMGMFPFLSKSMQSEMKTGQNSDTGMKTMALPDSSTSMSAQGFGDIRLDALYNFFRNENNSLIGRIGVSLPSGSINMKSDSMGKSAQLPYSMQLGSGTYDLLAGLTYSSGLGEWTWGGQLNGNFRLGKNSNNYSLGNAYNLTAWGGRRLLPWLHTFLRLNWDNWGNISGKDASLDEKMSPASRTDLRAGNRVDLLAGLNFMLPDFFGNNNLGVEFGLPVYQNLTGPQSASGWYINSGIQHLF